ncbi:class I SAM-dependent methyltransferase [Roseateles noduli]|uniref:class I SAM-dependent methyltransferase n=1 Tax=Roseateles noduli TaxID=2052484 RepID=UPI003D647B05
MHDDTSSFLTAPAVLEITPATLGGDRLGARHESLRRVLSRIQLGRLALTLPDGRCVEAVGPYPGPAATLHLHRWRPALRLLLQGDLGLAFSYRDGDWSTPDLTALLSFGIANETAFGAIAETRGPARWFSRLLHRANANTRSGSRHNIAAHYDLGNRFYERWLDDSMLYSSALYEEPVDPSHRESPTLESATPESPVPESLAFESAGETMGRSSSASASAFTASSASSAAGAGAVDSLERAQARRLDRIVELLDLRAGQRVLEIGCGWGTLAATLAKRCGVEVVGLTLSTEQLRFAQARAEQWGVADRVDLRLQDYRDVDGRFDRIVSIEMIEAVGEAYWPVYFATLRDRLKPDGVAVLQAITIDEQHFERYRANPDFIQRCIFPGGMLPTPERMAEEARKASLSFSTQARFGRGYAATLVEWRRRFLAEWPAIEAQGFDLPFKRLWEYYLCYCEAGFRAGRVDVGLYRLAHAG